jgi:hypothetical protein
MSDSERELAERANERAIKNRERFIYGPSRRFFARFEDYNGAVTAAATVVIACLTVSLCVDSGRQADTARDQFTIMRGQLEEMKVQSDITRSQIRANFTLSFGKTTRSDGVLVTPTFKNAGDSEAVRFLGWDDSQFFGKPFPADFDFSKFRGTAAFPGSAPGRSVVRGDTMLLPSRFISKDEIKKTLAQDGFAVVWGHIEYN